MSPGRGRLGPDARRALIREALAPASKTARDERQEERDAIRADLRGDAKPWGGTFATGLTKLASEEARHVVCSDCGYAGGRHSRFCSRAEVAA